MEANDRVICLIVEGMRCQKNCARRIRDALEAFDGVESAVVSFHDKNAIVTLRDGTHVSAVDLIQTIRHLDAGGVSKNFDAYMPGDDRCARTVVLSVDGMSCEANCATKVEAALVSTPGVQSAIVNFSNKRATVMVAPGSRLSEHELIESVHRLGKKFRAALVDDPRDPLHKTVRLAIDGMRCESNCSTKVLGALQSVAGVQSQSVAIDFPHRCVTVSFGPPCTIEALVQAVAAISPAGTFCARVTDTTMGIMHDNTNATDDGSLDIKTSSSNKNTRHRTLLDDVDRAKKTSLDRVTLSITGMTCNSCANSVETALRRTPGVVSAVVNFATENAAVVLDMDQAQGYRSLVDAIESIGYGASIVQAGDSTLSVSRDNRVKEIQMWKHRLMVALVLTFPMMLIMWILDAIPPIAHGLHSPVANIAGTTWLALLLWILATPVQFYAGHCFHMDAWNGLRHRVWGMSFLVSMGTNVAYFYGLASDVRSLVAQHTAFSVPDMYMTSAMLVTFIVAGKMMEAIAKARTNEALQKLFDLQPKVRP
jgi:copper ion binding protein